MAKLVRTLGLSLAFIAVATLTGPPFVAGQVKKDKGSAKVAAGTAAFEIYKSGKAGKEGFRFRLKDGAGKILAIASKSYKSKADCQKVIDTIRAHAATAKIVEVADKKK